MNYEVKQTTLISIEKVIVLHCIAVAPYFRCPKRDHLFLAGKTLEILVKTFFFLEITCFWPEKLHNTSKNFGLHKTGNSSYLSWPRKKIWVNYSVFIWQGVNETKKVKNPCSRGFEPCFRDSNKIRLNLHFMK